LHLHAAIGSVGDVWCPSVSGAPAAGTVGVLAAAMSVQDQVEGQMTGQSQGRPGRPAYIAVIGPGDPGDIIDSDLESAREGAGSWPRTAPS
jgi:hypothetical protein